MRRDEGPGKYDDLAAYAHEAANAATAIVIILNGNKGSGVSVKTTAIEPRDIPDLLHYFADALEEANAGDGDDAR